MLEAPSGSTEAYAAPMTRGEGAAAGTWAEHEASGRAEEATPGLSDAVIEAASLQGVTAIDGPETGGGLEPALAFLVAAGAFALGAWWRGGRARRGAPVPEAGAAPSPDDSPSESPGAGVTELDPAASAEEILTGLALVLPTLQLRIDPRGRVLAIGGAGSCVENAAQLGIAVGVPLQDRLPPASRGEFVDGLDELEAAPTEPGVRALDCDFEAEGGTSTYEVYLVQRPGLGLYVFAHDVSARRRVERERSELEARLRQAFKMEALGQLAGCMAHDFNNVLTVITGHSQLLRMQLEKDGVPHGDLAHIDRASGEAARLTRHLLDFARTKELHPEWLDLNELVLRLRRLLDRLLRDDIVLELELCEAPWQVRADASSLEQVIVNLALNAAEAMRSNGRFRIETSNVELGPADIELDAGLLPGRYVSLRCSDTGPGMSPEVQARAFEPFFTTKSLGRGTGLGLASVYGIVRQSGGRVRVESEEGSGTTFEICLPASEAPMPTRELQPRGAGLEGRETLLLCEDDAGVRGVMREALASAGYRLLVAETPEQASAIEEEFDDPLHLLITDVVMAGQTGGELAAVLRERRPGLAVLFVSGYSTEVVERYGILPPEDGLLAKPFTPRELLERVRARLDRAAALARR